jgi:hypothetical protein
MDVKLNIYAEKNNDGMMIAGFTNSIINEQNLRKVLRSCGFRIGTDKPLRPKAIVYDNPYTFVFWNDGTRTTVKANNDPFSEEYGLAMAFVRKIYGGNRSQFLRDVENGKEISELLSDFDK